MVLIEEHVINHSGGIVMRKWNRPTIVEIAVGMEINCYACAKL